MSLSPSITLAVTSFPMMDALRADKDLSAAKARPIWDLWAVCLEAERPNWDGYGAAPVTAETICAAEDFLAAIPESWPTPELSVDPDGDIAFDWIRGPHRILSASINARREVHFAGRFGSSRVSGREVFFDRLPGTLVAQLARLYF